MAEHNHVHGPSCGCREYANSAEGMDLLGSIMMDQIVCLNEEEDGSFRNAFKPYEDRFKGDAYFESVDDDAELLITIPFKEVVKLRRIIVISRDEDSNPAEMNVYINREGIDFQYVQDNRPLQSFDIVPNLDGSLENAVRPSKFNNVTDLTLHFKNDAIDQLSIRYIQLKGVKTIIKKKKLKATVYEVKPMVSDHEVYGQLKNVNQIE